MKTYAELFGREAIRRAVEDERLYTAKETLRGSDGMTRGWFLDQGVEKRVALVEKLVEARAGWSPAYRVEIPKGPGKEGTRPISFPTTLDAVRLMMLGDYLSEHAESVLCRVAVGYRPNISMTRTMRGAVQHVRERSAYAVCVTDIERFFDRIEWRHLDRAIGSLPADDELKRLLRAAVRVEARDGRSGTRIARAAGTPQGFAISPPLSNLVLANLDRRLERAAQPRSAHVRRFADDYFVAAGSVEEAEALRGVLVGGLGELGLTVKPGTGSVIDLRDGGRSVVWLGVEMRRERGVLTTRVPERSINSKAHRLRAEWEVGTLSSEAVEGSLAGTLRYFTCAVGKEEARRAVEEIVKKMGPTTEFARKAG